ncbi:S-adenosyl-L-methionine-dependent methyltransferase [Dunaliella salina]|uniref:Arsenite methyltransferase n=1 Tax=Dunaliella salina TaxID=3046 RepID=A0ABQ7G7H0_DUNSA|nr:S-adenosyl-L-methionine-dependent methyltransferase [Dunaliella salina]|eukprot:KAF5830546.1 S-adenosyl-L-methionine-dependent methyltransferase [Dunaliella salina]
MSCAATSDDDARRSVAKYYEELPSTGALKTSASSGCKIPPQHVRRFLAQVPEEISVRYFGCGTPVPAGLPGTGLKVLDLGCGTGRDCYVIARIVGSRGLVTGMDMSPLMLEVANKYVDSYTKDVLGFDSPNMRFVQGSIDNLQAAGIAAESQDLIISNCVHKYCDRRTPQELRKHNVLLSEGLGGSLYVNDFLRLARQVGFMDPRVLDKKEITIYDPELKELVGEARFFSITYRLFKVPGRLEDLCEDYGQVAVYKGTLPGLPSHYTLDDHHQFTKGKPMLVCGSTAAMVGETWLEDHFIVSGDRSCHYGAFSC